MVRGLCGPVDSHRSAIPTAARGHTTVLVCLPLVCDWIRQDSNPLALCCVSHTPLIHVVPASPGCHASYDLPPRSGICGGYRFMSHLILGLGPTRCSWIMATRSLSGEVQSIPDAH